MKVKARKYKLDIEFITDRVLSTAELAFMKERLRDEIDSPMKVGTMGGLIPATYQTEIVKLESSYDVAREWGEGA